MRLQNFITYSASQISLDGLPQTAANGSTIQTIITVAIGIVAAVSVLFVAIGGLRYILSQGDPGAVSTAKATIVYAIVGLVVAIIAQGIVVLVINGVSK